MSNFDITKYFKNQYISEASNRAKYDDMFKSDFPDNREMSKEKDAEILLAALESKGISASEDFGSGSYNGKKGYYIRVGSIDSWKDEEIEDVKKAIELANNQTDKYNFEYNSVSDYEMEYDGDRSYPASIQITVSNKQVNEEVDEDGFSDKIIISIIKPEEVSRLSKVLNSNNIPFKTEKLGKVTMFKFKSYDDVDKVEALISRNRIDVDESKMLNENENKALEALRDSLLTAFNKYGIKTDNEIDPSSLRLDFIPNTPKDFKSISTSLSKRFGQYDSKPFNILGNDYTVDIDSSVNVSGPEKGTGRIMLTISNTVNEMDINDPVLVRTRADKAKMDRFEKDQEQKIQNAKLGGGKDTPLRKLANMGKIAFLEKEREQLMRDMEQEAEPEGGPIADEYGRKLNRIDKSIAKLKGRKEITYNQAIAEGHSLEDEDIQVLKDAFNILFVKHPDWKGNSDFRRIIQNLIDTNDVSGIKEVVETIKLGENMIEEELCAKGKAYRKRRMAAGEKSSAYLSGRAVKVCKGQMSGKKKKK
jgi:hypothetical protein